MRYCSLATIGEMMNGAEHAEILGEDWEWQMGGESGVDVWSWRESDNFKKLKKGWNFLIQTRRDNKINFRIVD